jgi:hypothetical protein
MKNKIVLFILLIVSLFLLFITKVNADVTVTTPCEEKTDCTAVYKVGDVIDLTPVAAPGFVFLGWAATDNFCSGTGHCKGTIKETTTHDLVIAPVFDSNTVNLWIHVYGLDGGKVISSPEGINCISGAVCSAPFTRGTKVTLTAIPPTGKIWNWKNISGCNLTAANCIITMTTGKLGNVQFK